MGVGDVGVGGGNPIRVQSMTTPATTDTAATVTQIVRLVEAGCEIVRLAVPTSRDAENLPRIRRRLAAVGVRVPLVADVHFSPAVAMKAVEHVEKIRINPGNFADRRRGAFREYGDAEYAAGLARVESALAPLVKRCKELGVAMRIGTNHGSLSDRILNRYGDTSEGMVESALEFVRVCEAHGYRELILSMKAANPVVALEAYRRLAVRMSEEGMNHPLHLGITEAGEGEDGRIKSAIGIGALLEDGLGDTVRVSLTEDPVAEIPVAKALVAPFNERLAAASPTAVPPRVPRAIEIRSNGRRATRPVRVGPREIGGAHPVLVELPLGSLRNDGEVLRALESEAGSGVPPDTRAELASVTLEDERDIDGLRRLRASTEDAAPGLALSARIASEPAPRLAELVEEVARTAHRIHASVRAPLNDLDEKFVSRLLEASTVHGAALLLEAGSKGGDAEAAVDLAVELAERAKAAGCSGLLLGVDPTLASPLLAVRALAASLDGAGFDVPIVLVDRPARRGVDPLLFSSATLGGLLCEGLGDAIHIEAASAADSRRLAFSILQAARVRLTRTEFISCPSCGRTLFDLGAATTRIKARTAHLKGVKIAIMGCVVNGPGEMADADFGYVGWGEGKVALFVGKEMVEKDVPASEAEERLVQLIRRHGRWAEPSADKS